MPGVDDGVVAVDAEQPTRDVVEQFVERALLPRLADTTREQTVAGEKLHRRPLAGRTQRQCHRARGVPAKVDHVEGEIPDDDGVAAGEEAVGPHRQRLGVELMDGRRRTGGLGDRLEGLPVVEVLVGGDDQLQLRGLLGDQFDQQVRIVRGVDQHRLAGVRAGHDVGVVVHRAHRHLDDAHPRQGATGGGLGLDVTGVFIGDGNGAGSHEPRLEGVGSRA